MKIEEEYRNLISEMVLDPNVFNKLVYVFATSENTFVLEELQKDDITLTFSKKLAVLCLKDWLTQLRDKKYNHTKYDGEDEFINGVYKHCQYQWFMLIDSPQPINEEMVISKIVDINRLTPDKILEIIENEPNLLNLFAILAKTAMAECYLRVLIEQEKEKENV